MFFKEVQFFTDSRLTIADLFFFKKILMQITSVIGHGVRLSNFKFSLRKLRNYEA